jgi:hypothetical protein
VKASGAEAIRSVLATIPGLTDYDVHSDIRHGEWIVYARRFRWEARLVVPAQLAADAGALATFVPGVINSAITGHHEYLVDRLRERQGEGR